MSKYFSQRILFVLFISVFMQGNVFSQEDAFYDINKFESVDQLLPTANVFRTASGAPGNAYYQQKADYKIKVELDEEKNVITGEETITYYNNSPDVLNYIWLQLDQNIRSENSDSKKIEVDKIDGTLALKDYKAKYLNVFKGGFNIEEVKTAKGKKLHYVINSTMMRVDLPNKLQPGKSVVFKIKWWYNVNDYMSNRARSGYEPFADGNNLYVIAQWFPRMAVYNDR
ncbi:MAG: M1 family peptidase, partial [Ichthyobacteriaceae bacterium]|nr:M1 family peptidase [Ichthyobacteriaceae bacterium]